MAGQLGLPTQLVERCCRSTRAGCDFVFLFDCFEIVLWNPLVGDGRFDEKGKVNKFWDPFWDEYSGFQRKSEL